MNIRTRERLAAGTGIVSAALLAVSFVIGLSPEPPDLDAGPLAFAKYAAANEDAIQVQVLLNVLAMLFFLWFLGSIRATARTAEGGAGRVSAIASGGALVGVGFVILANVFAATAVYRSDNAPELTRLLIDLETMSIGVGAAAFAVFFLAIAVGSILDGGLPKALGWFALAAAIIATIGVVTHFSTTGVFAGDGAFGYWARYAAFVVWVAIASVVVYAAAGTTRRRRS
jgi:hypothetical protein